ncbi:MAG: 3-phosphoglycerate dehydrogenase [Verrucomicrobia bacterium]|nr:3-phosphoglycerate dehydrogenase [Verrucomicrobiota bacterium]MBV9130023.1 3-phosphoglycerate dehydrogenase [Verrucomicrobiota bacterium]MBV9643167.1 3-phosphoglycerate dehydrogenase [Verrucomicrobiota bacterium]
MPKVLVTDGIQQAGLDVLTQREDLEIDRCWNRPSEDDLINRAANADAILVGTTSITGRIIEAARKLKVVSRRGVGYDNIDLAALRRHKIPLTIVGSANASTVAEHTLCFILALAKQTIAYDRATRAGDWRFRESLFARDLLGKTLLLLGFGRVGRAVAVRAAAFDMRVLVYDPLVSEEVITGFRAEPVVDLLHGLAICDFLSVHVPLTAQTAGLIGRQELAAMRPSAFIISTARGGVVDEDCLVNALTEGLIRGAGLDVFNEEPPPPNHRLFGLNNVILSPHSAALTEECAQRMDTVAAINCLDAIDGRLDPTVIVPND